MALWILANDNFGEGMRGLKTPPEENDKFSAVEGSNK